MRMKELSGLNAILIRRTHQEGDEVAVASQGRGMNIDGNAQARWQPRRGL